MKTNLIHPIEPIYDESSEILILGSFPSVISREENMYYANPHNRFWKVMEILFEEEVNDKKVFCLKHHIALWDVIHSCTINKSSDASITDVKVNDFTKILKNSNIHTIFTTGSKANQLYNKYVSLDLPQIALPSTSSANASMKIDELVEKYKIILEYIHE